MTSPGKGRPEEGTPEYDWLYGRSPETGAAGGSDVTRPVRNPGRAAASDEATRMMPVQPRTARPAAAQTPAPTAPRPAPGGPDGPGGRAAPAPRAKPRGSRFRFRWLLALLLLWVVYLVAVPIIAWNNVSTVKAEPAGDRPAEQPGTTYLLVGSDSRKGLSKQERRELNTGGDVGQRTDTIMLLHTGSGPNLLASIPRDSLVEIPGRGKTKINAAFAYGGPKLLTQTVEQNTGVRVDHYVEIGMGGVVSAVDAVGGVEICPKQAMKDPLAGLDIKKGCQQADGKTALAYSRSRHAQSMGDMGRAAAQREVVGQVGKKAASPMTVINPFRYWALWSAAAEILKVSEGTGVVDAGRFALAMTKVSGKDGKTCGVPINSWQVTWDPARSKRFFDHIINDTVDEMPKGLCTPDGFKK